MLLIHNTNERFNFMANTYTLHEFIQNKQQFSQEATGDLSQILGAIMLASKIVHREINKAGLIDIAGSSGLENIQGEDQQKLDVYANDKFKAALAARGRVCGIASEEDDTFVAFPGIKGKSSKYVVAYDPIDGSSNIDVNVPVGTIFSILKRVSPEDSSVQLGDFLQKGTEQVAAGYIIYGSSTMLVYTTGDGVNGFTFDPSVGDYFLSHADMKFPTGGAMYSVNEGYAAKFDPKLRSYLEHCRTHSSTAGKPYTSRYIGSLVSDFHRNLIKGGIYIYPGYEGVAKGKLRMLYECSPLAFIAEQAGGKASDGERRILDIVPDELHQRSPYFVGSAHMVDEAEAFLRGEK